MVWDLNDGVSFEAAKEAPDSFRELAYANADDSVAGKLVE